MWTPASDPLIAVKSQSGPRGRRFGHIINHARGTGRGVIQVDEHNGGVVLIVCDLRMLCIAISANMLPFSLKAHPSRAPGGAL